MARKPPLRTATRRPLPTPVDRQLARVQELAGELEAGLDPLDALRALYRLSQQLAHATDQTIIQARQQGEPWPRIGGAIGVSGQRAQQRYVATLERVGGVVPNSAERAG
jgi:hypothetical protein